MQERQQKQSGVFLGVLSVALLASLIANGALVSQLAGVQSASQKTVWLSSDSAIRSSISGEQRFDAMDNLPEYDYAFGMRKNIQLSKENCLLDECFLNLDLALPAGELPESLARSVTALAVKEREVSSRIRADIALRMDSPLQKMQESQTIRVAVLEFLEKKYGLTSEASQGVPIRSTNTDEQTSCTQIQDQLKSLSEAYAAELALDAITGYPDLAFAYRQLEAQTRMMHLPLVETCATSA